MQLFISNEKSGTSVLFKLCLCWITDSREKQETRGESEGGDMQQTSSARIKHFNMRLKPLDHEVISYFAFTV